MRTLEAPNRFATGAVIKLTSAPVPNPLDSIDHVEFGLTSASKAAASHRLNQAVRRNRAFSSEGLLEIMFTWAFKGLVYPQIWEDPEVDLEALALTPQCHVVAIASGGCNVLSYLIADPGRITAVDLSRAHVALNRLKLAAARHLPSWQSFYRFFGAADEQANVAAYWRFLKENLDEETRAYWEGRALSGFGRRRISMFSRNLYRYGLLGYSIGLGHLVARAYGVELNKILLARSLEEQRAFFKTYLAPLFDKPFVRWATARQLSLYGLGIPPAQYAALGSGAPNMATVLRDRVEKLSCEFSIDDNYFAWQAFGRSYSDGGSGPVPPYLERAHFDTIRDRADRVEVLNRSFTEYLKSRPPQSLDRYVLLDAQDWMSDLQLNDLWREITRTARPGARVIFRTAAEPSLLPGRVDEPVLAQWRYQADQSRDLTRRDRSAIYGGFHLYVLGA
jgi:S-adenosylmethionine-diacylglycerol 3-amino-3-carboxypropyl transferase